MKKLLVILLTSSLWGTSLQAEVLEKKCYGDEQVKKLADMILDYQKCDMELKQKNELIKTHFIQIEGHGKTAYWQEPAYIVGGLTVSFSVGLALGFLWTSEKK